MIPIDWSTEKQRLIAQSIANAGMPLKPAPSPGWIKVSVCFRADDLAELDALAKKREMRRSPLIRWLIRRALTQPVPPGTIELRGPSPAHSLRIENVGTGRGEATA